MTNPIRIVVVDDHAIVREGMRMLLENVSTIEVVGEAEDGEAALKVVADLNPNVVLMDMTMPKLGGLEATRHIKASQPDTNVLVLTGSFGDDLNVKEAIQAGAVGYLLKDVLKADLVHAIERAAEGKATLHPEAQEELMRQSVTPDVFPHESLTSRELEVLKLLGQGLSNKKIASRLDLTEGTVKGYVSIVLSKLGVADRTQAALYAVRHDLNKT